MKALGLAFALASALSLPMPTIFEDLAFGIVPRQSEPSSCGYAVMAGLLNLEGTRGKPRPPGTPALITEEYLLTRYGGGVSPENRNPLSMLDLIGILSDFGLGAVPIKLDAWLLGEALQTAGPLIIHYDRPVSHFVLGLDADGEFLTVADPECGIVSLAVSEIAARASGFVLLPLPGEQPERMENNALSAGIRATKERRSMLALAASAPRAGSIQRKPAISPLHWEAGISIGSSGRESGLAAVFPGIFFGMEWATSEALTLLGNARIRLSIDPTLIEDLDLSSGIEWHRENKEKNRSLGAAIFIDSSLQNKGEPVSFAESVSGIFGDLS
ncbi:MAG TPA: cysteine peptidase family C39 domain-containing protein, partial [Rectinemataceae bacterium]|nr:cysteine peptidase family C39 domain-containing protein [Rectinemataceae bacterium]